MPKVFRQEKYPSRNWTHYGALHEWFNCRGWKLWLLIVNVWWIEINNLCIYIYCNQTNLITYNFEWHEHGLCKLYSCGHIKSVMMKWSAWCMYHFSWYQIDCYFSTKVRYGRDHFVYVPSQWETTLQCNGVSHWLGAYTIRDNFVYAPSQWETTLHCNGFSHWLGVYTKWPLYGYYSQHR